MMMMMTIMTCKCKKYDDDQNDFDDRAGFHHKRSDKDWMMNNYDLKDDDVDDDDVDVDDDDDDDHDVDIEAAANDEREESKGGPGKD